MNKENKHQEEVDRSKFEEVFYMYETPELGLFQSRVIIEGLEFASFESLKKELDDQFGLFTFKEDDDFDEYEIERGERITELIGRGGFDDNLICKEGVFFWNDLDFEYRHAGAFNSQYVHRVKCVEVPEDLAMIVNDEIKVIKSGRYEILQETVEFKNHNFRIEMFKISLLSGEIVNIPNNPGLFKVYEVDMTFIDYIDEYR